MKSHSYDFLVIRLTLVVSFLCFSYEIWIRTRLLQPSGRARTQSPLKVFVMVGQSNMEGHGYMDRMEDGKFLNGTLEWMVETYPETYGKLKTDDKNDWKKRDDVWIAYNRQNLPIVRPVMNSVGPLEAGYGGSKGGEGHEIGPELGFGWTVGDELGSSDGDAIVVAGNGGNDSGDMGIFLIKIAWGGRSLAVDYRPPSSGGDTGLYYEAMLANVYRTLGRLQDMVPGYTHDRGYSLEGFAWHQGWNDGCDANQTAEYESNLANLIRDIRTDLGVPKLPFVVGVSGMNGWNPEDPKRDAIVDAQLAVADATRYPEFAGTVAGVETRDFFRDKKPVSPGDQIYHWNNNCESYWLIGQAMGKAMVDLVHRAKKKVASGSIHSVLASANHRDDSVGWSESLLRSMNVLDTSIE